MADFLSRAMEPIEAATVTYLAAIFSDGLSEQYRDDQDHEKDATAQDSDREATAQDSDRESSDLDTVADDPDYPVYKKPRPLAAGGSDTEEEIEFLRHKSAETQLAAIGPAGTIKQALDEVHHDRLGHKGALATWKEVHMRYPNLSVSMKQVSAYVQDCGTCQKIRATPSDPMTMQKSLPVFHARAVTHVDTTERLHVGDRLFISAHVWNSPTWHIYQRGILPVTLRNREPLLLAVVEKITAKRIDISIPHLHLHRGASMITYKKPMTIQNMKLWTCREHDLRESMQVALGVQELDACTLREELQRATGMIR